MIVIIIYKYFIFNSDNNKQKNAVHIESTMNAI